MVNLANFMMCRGIWSWILFIYLFIFIIYPPSHSAGTDLLSITLLFFRVHVLLHLSFLIHC